ncbi:NAD/NADP octopine/nopaline dehydrogenase family protein [Aminobacter sp. MDW-2]|jgi:opine dehydrogenase|uniref:NAD/NADP octopine/nopaline dehydrogenase family protein n=1 Tax=Aminobacter sp. MDW-2 TaxID=2666139 RepID=UPI0012B14401|nr:NAD/NADP octopine/nopaline dehydrogenase family protein [Aminobacter sp. MDW-2]MRX37530.1 NAD/NADP octopine/nopaline dehydrogenase [Aminobacter sp. MDW-2]QNH37624.1 NAD/NADP octopine/nopaline dehydrogenase family protein [Aminobacter sp. MDW-2]
MKVAVLGAGAGGAASVAELVQAGNDVHFWARSAETLEPHVKLGGVAYEGKLGEGVAKPALITTDLKAAIDGVDVAVVVLPTFSHSAIASALAAAGWSSTRPVVLNPGHTGGALEFAETFSRTGRAAPPVVEFSTLTYVARKYRPDGVTVSGRAKQLKAAALKGGSEVLEIAGKLYPGLTPVADVIASDLSNVNMVLHPPAAVLAAAWVEATGGNFTFYVDAMTPGVARVMKQLDNERLAVARAFGHDLPNLVEEMKLLGTVEADVTDTSDFRAAIAGGEANKRIKGPDSLEYRYYKEDFGHGLLPFLEFAKIAGVETPVAHSLYSLAQIAVGTNYRKGGRTAEAMGIAGMSRDQVIQKVRAK